MRALHLIKSSVGATWALRQTRELVKLGVEVHAAMPAGPLVSRYEGQGVTVHTGQFSLPTSRPDRWPGLFSEFRALVDRVKPDVIHSHFVGTTLTMRLALGRRSPIPRLFQVPGPLHLEHPVFRRAEIRSAGPLDSWIGSCRWTCDRYLRSGISPDRVFLSYYGSDLDEIRPHPPGALRAELGLDAAAPIVGMVAFMYPPKRYLGQKVGLKGHEDLIDALAICCEQHSSIHGVFIGGAWNNATAYERRVVDYGRRRLGGHAHFLGTRFDVPELYADIDVAVHPSHSENLGGAAESLLLGVPTVATDVGGFPDIVIPNETGWLAPAHSPSALADAVLDALSHRDEARARALKGQERARQILDIRTNAREIRSIYRVVADRGASPSSRSTPS